MPSKNWVSDHAGAVPVAASVPGARLRLAVAVIGVVAIWLVALPAAGRLAVVRRHIERLEAARIDPSAMYYTELEMIGDVRSQLSDFQARHPDALWSGRLDESTPRARLIKSAGNTRRLGG